MTIRCQDGYDDCHGMHGDDYHAAPSRAKTLGEMTPDERLAAIRRAAVLLQAELEASSAAIGRILADEPEHEHQEVPATALVALVADAIIALGPDTSREDAIDLAAKLLDLVPWLAASASDYAKSTDPDWGQTTFWGAVQAAFEEADPIDVPKRDQEETPS